VPKIHISYFLKRNSYFKFEGFFSLKKFDTFFENFLLHHAVILKDDFFSFRTISIRDFQLLFLKPAQNMKVLFFENIYIFQKLVTQRKTVTIKDRAIFSAERFSGQICR
jgi:hypothetical protein